MASRLVWTTSHAVLLGLRESLAHQVYTIQRLCVAIIQALAAYIVPLFVFDTLYPRRKVGTAARPSIW